MLDRILFVFWLPLEIVRSVKRLKVVHEALKASPCPDDVADATVRVRMGTATIEYEERSQDRGILAWCAMTLFLNDPYLKLAQTTWIRIESRDGRCMAHARRFPNGRVEFVKVAR